MEHNDEEAVKQFKLKRLIRQLENAEGDGTSMITVIISPGKKISDIQKSLLEEAGKADKIKDRQNRQKVVKSIMSVKEKLKTYSVVPPNGLLVYSGEVMAANGKGAGRIMVDFEPYRAINTQLYKCSNKFVTQPLKSLLTTTETYGFIIVDGMGTLFGTLQGNAREVLNKFSVDLPKKHGRGGQSCQRFGRIRMEKRAAYVRKVCEAAVPCYIENDMPNVAGLIIAGYADFKNLVAESQFLDQRLKKKIVNIADISYGGEQGFNQAIDLSKGCLQGIKLVREQQQISQFYEEINMDTGKIVYGVADTMKALEGSVAAQILSWDELEIYRLEIKDRKTEEVEVKYFKSGDELDKFLTQDGEEFDVLESEALIDWLAENHKSFGTDLVFVTDKSPEGNQFVKGFGGIAAFLRYKWESEMDFEDNDDEDDDEDFI